MANKQIEIYFIKPKEAHNLITNPSIEKGTTGHNVRNSTIARVTSHQRRGAACLEVTPNSGAIAGDYWSIQLTAGKQYSFSVDVEDVAGQVFNVYIANTSHVAQSSVTYWTGKGRWTRRSVSFTPGTTTTYYLEVVRTAVASTTKFYLDGFQLEEGEESTYFDGDLKGFNRTYRQYMWLGTPHASISWRSGDTRSGGTMFRLSSVAQILGTFGLGMALFTHSVTPIGKMGSLFQASRVDDREFQIAAIIDQNEFQDVLSARQQILNAVRPDVTSNEEPLIVRWLLKDENGELISDPVDIWAHYASGLEHDTTNEYAQTQDKTLIKFKAYFPLVIRDGESAVNLAMNQAITNGANIIYRPLTGNWTGGGIVSAVTRLTQAPDGTLYAISGSLNVVQWNGTSWTTIGTATIVNAIAVAPDGTLYAGGEFTSISGVSASRAAKWNGSTWSALGTGLGASSEVKDIVVDDSGNAYFVGSFILAGGVTVYGVAKWDGSAWSAVGNPNSPASIERALLHSGKLYVFGGSDYVSNTFFFKYWDGATWTDITPGEGITFQSAAFSNDGRLWGAGDYFVTSVGDWAQVHSWNGTVWKKEIESLEDMSNFYYIYFGKSGEMYLTGLYSTINGVTLPAGWLDGNIAVIRNGTVTPLDVTIASTSVLVSMAETANGTFWFAGQWSSAQSSGVTVANPGAMAYPQIVFTGPGTIWQLNNYSTGKKMYFRDLTLANGEIATLVLNPKKFSFESNWRGNLRTHIANGSDLDWYLAPNNNNVSLYMTGTTGSSGAVMTWQPLGWSVDGAVP